MQSNPLDVGREMSADYMTCGILTAVIVGRQTRPTALAIMRHHRIIVYSVDNNTYVSRP